MKKRFTKVLLVWMLAFSMVAGLFAPHLTAFASDSSGKTYYVATNGSDSNPGTKEAPFSTLVKAFNQLVSGDTLIIRGGKYNGYLQVIGKDNVTIKNYADEKVNIENVSANIGYLIYVGQSSNVVISGLTLTMNKTAENWNSIYVDTSKNVEIKDCEFANGEGGVITRQGCSNISIHNNVFHNIGWAYGAVLLWDAWDSKVYNNLFYEADFCIDFYGSKTTNNIIYNNTFYNNSSYDIAATSNSGIAHDNIICNNIFSSKIENQNYLNPDAKIDNFMAKNKFDYNCYNSTSFSDGVITNDGLKLQDIKNQGLEANGFMGDPKFLNTDLKQLQIGRNSDCHGKGTDKYVPDYDFNYEKRTKPVDIGAYIYKDNVNYYVSSKGNDSNPGTDSSPFKTIKYALSVMQPNDKLFIKAGNYDEAISLNSKSDITIKNYENDSPIIEQPVNIENCSNISLAGLILNKSFIIDASKNIKAVGIDINNGSLKVQNTDGYQISSCRIHDYENDGAFIIDSSKNSDISNNILTDNKKKCIILQGKNCINNRFYNNTFYDNGTDLMIAYTENSNGNIFKNNIFSDKLCIVNDDILKADTFDFNCYNKSLLSKGTGIIDVYDKDGKCIKTYSTIDEMKKAGIEKNGLSCDPLFLNIINNDFRIRKTSECVGKGTSDGAPLYDFTGLKRESPYDMGAYKCTGAVNDYYVSLSGSDTNPGTDKLPFRSIQHAADVMYPGETVYIKGGAYDESITINNKIGSAAENFSIKPVSGENVILDSDNKQGSAISIDKNSSFWNIDGISIKNYTKNGIDLKGSANNITLSNITISGVGENCISGENTENCMAFDIRSSGGKNGIALMRSDHWNIAKSSFDKSFESAVNIAESNNCKITSSLFTNSKIGLYLYNASNVLAYNNDFYGNTKQDLNIDQGSVKNIIKNNIFGSQNAENSIKINDINNDLDYNCYAESDKILNVSQIISFDKFKEYGREENGIQADPIFNDPANRDFTLKPHSPCAKKGLKNDDTPLEGFDGTSFDMPMDIGALYTPYSLNVYYVSTKGDDKNDGSIDHPWRTIKKGADSIKQSDTLYVRGGVYSERVNLYNRKGSPNCYFTIKNYNNEEVIMDSDFAEDVALRFDNCSYWRIDGLKFRKYEGAGVWVTDASEYIDMENLDISYIDNPKYHINGTEGILGDGGNFSTVRNCYIHDIGQTLLESADNAVYIGYGAHNWTFDSNRIENVPGAGLQLYGHPTGGDYSVITNNVIKDCMDGIILTMLKGVTVSNNTFINNWAADIYTDWWVNDSVIQNNILYNDLPKDYKVRVEDKNKQGQIKEIGISPIPLLIQCEDVNNNKFNNNIVFNKYFGNRVLDLAQVRSMSDYLKTQKLNIFEKYVEADPMFVDASNNNFMLKSNSPCIDAGVSDKAPKVDITGHVRINAPDIGAYEYIPAAVFSSADISVPKTELVTGDTEKINITGKMSDGTAADISKANVKYIIGDTKVIDAANGILTAKAAGTTYVIVSVTLGDITIQSNRIIINVSSPTVSPKPNPGGNKKPNLPKTGTFADTILLLFIGAFLSAAGSIVLYSKKIKKVK